MIIFGNRAITSKKAEGEFYCPSCGIHRSYVHKSVRRFFTLYFIPLIPLDSLGEYIECRTCGETYKKEVLSIDPGAENTDIQPEFERAILRVMLGMMLADGKAEDKEKQTLREIHQRLTNKSISDEEITANVNYLKDTGLRYMEELQQIAQALNDHGKEMVVYAAVMVASSDGSFTDEEEKLLGQIAQALAMSPAHFKGLLNELCYVDTEEE